MRRFTSVVVAAGVVVSLAGCAGSGSAASGCTHTFTSGGNASLVTANGALGKDPNATFPTPLVATKPQTASTVTGTGSLVRPGDTVNIQVTIYNGATGKNLISTDYTGTGVLFGAVAGVPAFGSIVQCATVGSRVAAVGTALELIGATAVQQNKLAVQPTDTVVVVADIMNSYLGRANGADQLPQAGLPSIVLAPNGQPGFTFPSSPIPAQLRIATLKQGNGQVVQAKDRVVVNYTGVLWDTKKVFDSTWDRNVPAVLNAVSLTDDPTRGVVPGFAKALIGAHVGSQVLVVIPPGADGYPKGSAPSAVPDGSTMVFVVDILGISK